MLVQKPKWRRRFFAKSLNFCHDKLLKMAVPVRWFFKLKNKILIHDLNKTALVELSRPFCAVPKPEEPESFESNSKSVDGFRVLQLYPKPPPPVEKKPMRFQPDLPRTEKMSPDQDWTNVWPGPRTFHPAVVPLPIRQGYNKFGPPPDKFGNTELMKIPNFLHLTPPAIEKHCNALRKFCTKWPSALDRQTLAKNFPIEIITSDYCHSSTSIRDKNARIVTLKIKLRSLDLDYHAKDKFLRLVGERYDPATDYVTITTDACPIKKQNYDYAYYLLTALYFESWKHEDWEREKSDEDMETYNFLNRQSYKNIKKLFEYNNKDVPDIKEFQKAVEKWHNKGDKETTIGKYKNAALGILSLPPFEKD